MPPENTQNPYEQNNNTPPPPPPPQPGPVQPTQPQPPMPPTENPVQPPADVVSPQVVSPNPLPQPMQQPGINPAGPSPSVQQPMQTSQPGPVVMGGPVVGQDNTMPNQSPGMINAAPGIPGGKPKKNIKKLVIIIVAALIGIAAIAFGAMTIMKMLNGGSVNFSKTETVTGDGYTMDVPKDYGKVTDDDGEIYFYTDSKEENKKITTSEELDNSEAEGQAAIFVAIQSQPGISSGIKSLIDAGQKQQLIDGFKEGFSGGAGSSADSTDKFDIDLSNSNIEEAPAAEGETLAFSGTLSGKGKDKSGKEINLKGKLRIGITENDKLALIMVIAEESIYEKQSEAIDKSINSFKAN
jgi:hypothetical protein